MSRQELLFMQLFGGGTTGQQATGWLYVVFLVFLLAVPILKPDRIRVAKSFRASFFYFALSVTVPPVLSTLMYSLQQNGAGGGGFGGGIGGAANADGIPTLLLLNGAGPLLFCVSLVLAMKAVVPSFIPPVESQNSSLRSSGGSSSLFDDQSSE